MKRVMIINWRWPDVKRNSQPINIDLTDKEVELFLSNYSDNDSSKEELFNFIMKTCSQEECMVLGLLHYNTKTDSDGSIYYTDLQKLCQDKGNIKFKNITGDHTSNLNYIYNATYGMINDSGTIKTYKDALNSNNFGYVWDYYWIKLDKDYHKKKILELWLPLAIDLQGLSEIKNDTQKAENYYEEIRSSVINIDKAIYKKDWKSDFVRWSDIEKTIDKEYSSFDPFDLFNDITGTDKFSEFDEKYLANSHFLPNWLTKVIEATDKLL